MEWNFDQLLFVGITMIPPPPFSLSSTKVTERNESDFLALESLSASFFALSFLFLHKFFLLLFFSLNLTFLLSSAAISFLFFSLF